MVRISKRERCTPQWIERLQELPQYTPVVERLLRGEGLASIVRWLLAQEDCGPFTGLSYSTMWLYVSALKQRLEEQAKQRRRDERSRRTQRLNEAAEVFTKLNSGSTKPAIVPATEDMPAVLTQEEMLRQQIANIDSRGVVRLILEEHLPHIRTNKEWEKKTGMPVPFWYQDMGVLTDVATILQKTEAGDKLLGIHAENRKPAEEPPLSPEAQRIAELSDVDRSLLREAGEKFKILLTHHLQEAQSTNAEAGECSGVSSVASYEGSMSKSE